MEMENDKRDGNMKIINGNKKKALWGQTNVKTRKE